MNTKRNQGFTLVELLVVIGILGILMGALFPAISNAMMQANMTAMGMRGKDIYVAITGANTEREAMGLSSVWPRTQAAEGAASNPDIADKAYSAAYDYFNDLYDADNLGDTKKHQPYVQGFDFGKLAGAGVVAPSGGNELKAENVGWCIGANVRDEMEDLIPVLVTRNVTCSKLLRKYGGSTSAGNKVDVPVGKTAEGADVKYDTPFSNKGFVMIRKGGAIVKTTAKYARYDVIYNKQSFELPEATEDMDQFTYLTPSSKVSTLAEAE